MPPQHRIFLTGVTGQVGGALRPLLAPLGELYAPTRAELDLTDPAAVRAAVQQFRPTWIINPAAYTAVDKAESEPALAETVNATIPAVLGEEAARLNASVVHFSTDYVFDGSSPRPYTEQDPTAPLGVYGRTKLAGEQALARSGACHIILRTSWVYASTGKNFLLTILKLARERAELRIVADQHGAPTAARDLAQLAAQLVSLEADLSETGGVFHATSAGETTWHGFADEAVRQQQAREPGTRFATLVPISTAEYPTPARRPANSRLNCDRLAEVHGVRLPAWQEALATVLSERPA